MKKLTIISILLAALLLLSGCGDKESGIFFSIEQERKLDNNNLPDAGTFTSMVKLVNDYYVSTGAVYRVGDADNFDYHLDGSTGKWTKIANPSGTLCAGLGVVSGTLYGIFFENPSPEDPADFDSHLYSFNTVGDVWSLVTSNSANTYTIEKMAVANGVAFLLGYTLDGSNNREYAVHTWDGTTFTADVLTVLDQYSRFDAAFDGTNYWVAYGYGLYSNTTPATIAVNATAATDMMATTTPAKQYMGIHYSPAPYNQLLVCQNGGALYRSSDGGTSWTALTNTISTVPYDFGDFTVDTDDYILLATSDGYLEFTGTLDDSAVFSLPSGTTDYDNYLTLDLRYALTNGFFADQGVATSGSGAQDVLFVLTTGTGLWANRLYSDGSRYWDWE